MISQIDGINAEHRRKFNADRMPIIQRAEQPVQDDHCVPGSILAEVKFHERLANVRFFQIFRARQYLRGVFTLSSCEPHFRGTGSLVAWQTLARSCKDRAPRSICLATAAAAATGNRNGKPTPDRLRTNRAPPFHGPPSKCFNSSTETNGMSHARKRIRSAEELLSAVRMPPRGPQRITQSRRMTRTRFPVFRETPLMINNIDLLPSRNCDLSQPMRVLRPPARMQISIFGVETFSQQPHLSHQGRSDVNSTKTMTVCCAASAGSNRADPVVLHLHRLAFQKQTANMRYH